MSPDKWFIVDIKNGEETTQHVFSGNYGGYLGSDSWRLSTNIVSTERLKDEKEREYWRFVCRSGTIYECYDACYGSSGYMGNVYLGLQEKNPDTMSVNESFNPQKP